MKTTICMSPIVRSIGGVLAIGIWLKFVAVAANGQAAEPEHESKASWTISDALSSEYSADWPISPDCQWAIETKVYPDIDQNKYVENLFLSNLTNGQELQLTRGDDGCIYPKWSPNGRLIAFLSSRSGGNQIWLINPAGGEAWKLTAGDRAVNAFGWAGSNDIIYSAQEEPSTFETTNNDKKDFTQVVEDDEREPPVRLFKVNVQSGTVTRLTDNRDHITNFTLSPDAGYVVMSSDSRLRSSYDWSAAPLIFLTNLKTGDRKPIFTEGGYHLDWPVYWERDGRGFYAVYAHARNPKYAYPAVLDVCHYDLRTGAIDNVDLGWERGLAGLALADIPDVQVTTNGFITLLADGVRTRLARYSRHGREWRREWIGGVHTTNILVVQLGQDERTLLYDYSSPSEPCQWYRATLDGNQLTSPLKLTSLNAGLQKKEFARSEVVHWKGARGEMTEGLLFYPMDYQPGTKYPLVVEIHGGPEESFQDRWYESPLYNNNLLNERGAFVFRPNYHGSCDYGLAWADSNIGRLNEFECKDINSGVDYLIQRGLADPTKLAVMGWSNGGTLVAALTADTHRYAVAIAGDGPIDYVDYWAKSDVGGRFCAEYFGGVPLDHPAAVERGSPFYQLASVTTPTLILFGADDPRVPVDQGWMYYRALQQSGKAKVRFVLFPGEGHGPSRPVYIKRALEEELAWFDQYLFKRKGNSGS